MDKFSVSPLSCFQHFAQACSHLFFEQVCVLEEKLEQTARRTNINFWRSKEAAIACWNPECHVGFRQNEQLKSAQHARMRSGRSYLMAQKENVAVNCAILCQFCFNFEYRGSFLCSSGTRLFARRSIPSRLFKMFLTYC